MPVDVPELKTSKLPQCNVPNLAAAEKFFSLVFTKF